MDIEKFRSYVCERFPSPWAVEFTGEGSGTATCPLYVLESCGMLPQPLRHDFESEVEECGVDFEESEGSTPDDDPEGFGEFHTYWAECNGYVGVAELSLRDGCVAVSRLYSRAPGVKQADQGGHE